MEVAVVSYTPRMQKMKNGEERQIAFGWIEDNPWESGDKERGGITRIGGVIVKI